MNDFLITEPDVLKHSPVRVLFGSGAINALGREAVREGATRVLVVTDPDIAAIGYMDRAQASLKEQGLSVATYPGAAENPTTDHVEPGVSLAMATRIDFIVGIGGGSAMDCAKGINILLTQGGEMADFIGVNKTTEPMLPMILIPTTAGTGSEAQSFALISHPDTHRKMPCGDRRLPKEGGLRPRVAILDPELTKTQPKLVAAATGIDALTHAIESAGSTARNDVSLSFSEAAWSLLSGAFERSLADPEDVDAQADMLMGAHLAGGAIETSMLGAAHSCANPLTTHFNIIHGQAVGAMLPHVIRFNAQQGINPYDRINDDADRLADRVTALLNVGCLKSKLSELGVTEADLDMLAAEAAEQWTARFNPTPVTSKELRDLYAAAM
jgi:alcohol dehydrogenase